MAAKNSSNTGGAGRKQGSNGYGESTQAIRVPASRGRGQVAGFRQAFAIGRCRSVGENGLALGAENPGYADIAVKEDIDGAVWGSVATVIRAL